jgi:hypothetical protein
VNRERSPFTIHRLTLDPVHDSLPDTHQSRASRDMHHVRK